MKRTGLRIAFPLFVIAERFQIKILFYQEETRGQVANEVRKLCPKGRGFESFLCVDCFSFTFHSDQTQSMDTNLLETLTWHSETE